jgi:hypothetical protein
MSCYVYKTASSCVEYISCGCVWRDDVCSGLIDFKCLEQKDDLQYDDIKFVIIAINVLSFIFLFMIFMYIIQLVIRGSANGCCCSNYESNNEQNSENREDYNMNAIAVFYP